jgi:hypothetical protein
VATPEGPLRRAFSFRAQGFRRRDHRAAEQQALERLMQGRTSLVLAHRLARLQFDH